MWMSAKTRRRRARTVLQRGQCGLRAFVERKIRITFVRLLSFADEKLMEKKIIKKKMAIILVIPDIRIINN